MLSVEIDEWRKIGIGLTFFGLLFTLLGVLLFFDKGLIAMGNLLFISGITLVIGLRRTVGFFFQRHKWKGTLCFLGGFAIVLIGRPIIGMIIEAFGFINLFGDFFPTFFRFARGLPIISSLLDLPGLRSLTRDTDRILPD